jgi:hypothetical protein
MTGATGRIGLRSGLRRLGAGLIAYGLVGLAFALIGLVALVSVGGRVGDLADRTSAQVEGVVAALDQTATALTDAGTSATSFAVTLERTPPAVRQTAQTIGNLRANLVAVEDRLARITILGTRPLQDVASLFGQMASDLTGLDTRLELIASDLEGNKGALLTNATSLGALGARMQDLAGDLRGGAVTDSLGDVQATLTTVFILLVTWTAIPAIGALGLGWWLRSELDDDRPEPDAGGARKDAGGVTDPPADGSIG